MICECLILFVLGLFLDEGCFELFLMFLDI